MDTPLKMLSDEILDHALSSPEQEVCGLIATKSGNLRYFKCENVHPDPAHNFTIDPIELFGLLERGWTLQVVVHSHPYGHKEPSGTDLSNFPWHYVDTGYIIVLGDDPVVVIYNPSGVVARITHRSAHASS